MQLRGSWIIELGELGALNRSELEREKAFISQQVERFRLPYGHRLVHHPRQCVFIGTTNSDTWLKDETGGRRFWPVKCGPINLDALANDRDQLWAEALLRYREGVHWWLEDAEVIKEAIEEQRGRYAADVWQEKVTIAAEEEAEKQASLTGGKKDSKGNGSVAIQEILQRIGIETPKQDQAATNRVARCLKAAGWERFKSGPRSAREWRYHKVAEPVTQSEAVTQ
jgi:putative DNA primase/helicase